MTLNLESQVRGDKEAHRWRMTMHLDGCHWYASSYRCVDCGAGLAMTDERDFNGDPWSSMWMDDLAYEGEDSGCERCAELRDGAEPSHRMDYFPAGFGAES